MSANSHNACPACHPDLIGYVGKPLWNGRENHITEMHAQELGYDLDMRENWEFGIVNGDTLRSTYEASCWTCGFHFEVTHEDPIPGLEKKP